MPVKDSQDDTDLVEVLENIAEKSVHEEWGMGWYMGKVNLYSVDIFHSVCFK